MRGFTVLLMVLVGAVFVAGPAGLLAKLTPESLDLSFWATVVFVYYVLATLLPIDKIIGKIYPIFAIALIFMAAGILFMIFWHHPALPELTDGIANTHPDGLPIFPMMFISIACGAISGFHATQSPLMARCMTNEKYGRPVFYGAMITEGIVALIWAAAATYFFHTEEGSALFAAGSGNDNAAVIVDSITKEWLGVVGGFLAILGVIAAPITSGDTAFRSARLIVADFLRVDQKPILKRLMISVPLFVAGYIILHANFSRTVALLCLVQPDAGRLHAMGADGLSDPETQTVRYHADPRAVYDGRLFDLYPDRTGGTAPAARTGLLARRSRYPVHIRPVPRVAQQIPAAESDDLTGTDSSIKRKGIFMRKIPFRLIPAAAVPPARKRFAS